MYIDTSFVGGISGVSAILICSIVTAILKSFNKKGKK